MSVRTLVAYVAASVLAPAVALGDALDFEAADVGTVPSGWTVAMTSDGGQPRWEVVRDATSPSGEKVLAQVSDDPTPGRFPLAIYEDVQAVDGSVSVRFKPVSGRVDQAAGRGNDYGVEHRVPAQAWSTLAVAFRGTRFVVAFDGAPLFEVEDSTFTTAGKVGLWTKADSVTYFDGFEVAVR